MADLRDLTSPFLVVELADEAATRQLANDIGVILGTGDLLCLSGDLGAGKSTFARALIRSLAGDPDLDVPSPTFTLVQPYELDRFDLAHLDLYRIEDPEELTDLGLDDLLETGAALVEWPEMAGDFLPADALWLQFSEADAGSERRKVLFHSTCDRWPDRTTATLAARAFLDPAMGQDAQRTFLAGDASLRTFERVLSPKQTAVLMRWPFQGETLPDAVRNYMETAHLALDCRSVIAVGSELRRHGFRAPALLKADVDQGLILSEYLGGQTILSDGEPVAERYRQAVQVLATMHNQSWPASVPLDDGTAYTLPQYSQKALITEASLVLDWYLPLKTGDAVSATIRQEFEAVWAAALAAIDDAQTGWVLRDYHSPNLLWQPEGEGTDRIGLIDFQDAVIGPVAYDVASLLLDARADIAPGLESELFEAYVQDRIAGPEEFDRDVFSRAYYVMAAQRISKILGIFVRLAKRDDKPAYLRHLPRMEAYLERVLDAPVLTDLKEWYRRNRA